MLHSSNHPKLDYVAQETETENGDTFLNHYVGVYDPSQDTLQLVPARKVIIRSTVKTIAPTSPVTDEEEENDTSVPNNVSARNTLGLTFGTKKSQKAIRSLTENDIIPTRPGAALDPLASAVMDSMAASTADMPSPEAIQAEAVSNKPIPKPNFEAETPAEVYTLDDLVGMQTLRSMQVKEWIDKENDGEEVITRSRFVSARIARMVKAEEVKELKALKYLLLLIEWYLALKKVGQNSSATLEVPKKEQWETVLPGWNNAAIAAVERRFTERGNLLVLLLSPLCYSSRQWGMEITDTRLLHYSVLNRWHTNLLLTHILALALVIDDCNVDVHDIREDLHLDNKQYVPSHSLLLSPSPQSTIRFTQNPILFTQQKKQNIKTT